MEIWTEADVRALATAVKGGVLRVRYDGPPAREVQYQSLADMRALLASMRQEADRAAGNATNFRFASSSKGFGSMQGDGNGDGTGQ